MKWQHHAALNSKALKWTHFSLLDSVVQEISLQLIKKLNRTYHSFSRLLGWLFQVWSEGKWSKNQCKQTQEELSTYKGIYECTRLRCQPLSLLAEHQGKGCAAPKSLHLQVTIVVLHTLALSCLLNTVTDLQGFQKSEQNQRHLYSP